MALYSDSFGIIRIIDHNPINYENPIYIYEITNQ